MVQEYILSAFQLSKIWKAIKGVNKTSINFLKNIWDGEGDPWWEYIGLLIPRLLLSTLLFIGTGAILTMMIAIGAVSAGIIGGSFQTLRGLLFTLIGLLPPDKEYFFNGLKDLGIGLLKVIGGAAISGIIALIIMSGIGAPAAAAIAPLSLAGQAVGTMIAPIIMTINTAITSTLIPAIATGVTTAIGIISSNLPVIIPIAIAIGSVISLSVISKLTRKIFGKDKTTTALQQTQTSKTARMPFKFSSTPTEQQNTHHQTNNNNTNTQPIVRVPPQSKKTPSAR